MSTVVKRGIRRTLPRESILESLRNELGEVKRRLAHYSKLTTHLELQMEQLERERERAFRHALELAETIETEERLALITLELDTGPGAQRRMRERQVLDLLVSRGELSSAQITAALHVSAGHAHSVLGDLCRSGRVERVRQGIYRPRGS